MNTEDLQSFEEWWAKEKGTGNFGQLITVAHEAWLAATARERERCLNEARAVQIEYERSAHRSFGEIADQHNAAAQAALEISIAIRGTDGGERR